MVADEQSLWECGGGLTALAKMEWRLGTHDVLERAGEAKERGIDQGSMSYPARVTFASSAPQNHGRKYNDDE